jgi:hypothetical protein
MVDPPPAGIVLASNVQAASDGRSAHDSCTGCIYPVCGATATCKLATPPTPTVAVPVTETLNPFTTVVVPVTVSVNTVEILATELASPA